MTSAIATSAIDRRFGRRTPVLQNHGVKDFPTDQASPGGKPALVRLVLQVEKITPYHQSSASWTIHPISLRYHFMVRHCYPRFCGVSVESGCASAPTVGSVLALLLR